MASAFVLLAMCTALEAAADPFEGVLCDGPHEFNAEAQDQAYAWLDRWLQSGP